MYCQPGSLHACRAETGRICPLFLDSARFRYRSALSVGTLSATLWSPRCRDLAGCQPLATARRMRFWHCNCGHTSCLPYLATVRRSKFSFCKELTWNRERLTLRFIATRSKTKKKENGIHSETMPSTLAKEGKSTQVELPPACISQLKLKDGCKQAKGSHMPQYGNLPESMGETSGWKFKIFKIEPNKCKRNSCCSTQKLQQKKPTTPPGPA